MIYKLKKRLIGLRMLDAFALIVVLGPYSLLNDRLSCFLIASTLIISKSIYTGKTTYEFIKTDSKILRRWYYDHHIRYFIPLTLVIYILIFLLYTTKGII